MSYITKDSGEREAFDTGAVRDTQEGKIKYGAIPTQVLRWLAEGFAEKGPDAKAVVSIGEPGARFDLIPHEMIHRLAALYERGAAKYGDDNWKKGIPMSRVYESLFRHLIAWREGQTDEDHITAVIWNATTLLCYDKWVASGRLPATIRDIP